MTRGRAWMALALVLGLGLLARPALAQYPPATAPGEPPPFHQAPPPPSPYAGPAVVDPEWFAGGAGPGAGPGPGCGGRSCGNLLRRFGIHCWSDPTLPICTNGRSQLVFIFGSCKAFFGEPCLAQKPLVPVPPGYEPFPYGRPGR